MRRLNPAPGMMLGFISAMYGSGQETMGLLLKEPVDQASRQVVPSRILVNLAFESENGRPPHRRSLPRRSLPDLSADPDVPILSP